MRHPIELRAHSPWGQTSLSSFAFILGTGFVRHRVAHYVLVPRSSTEITIKLPCGEKRRNQQWRVAGTRDNRRVIIDNHEIRAHVHANLGKTSYNIGLNVP